MNIGIIIIIGFLSIWALGVFWGAIGGLSKTFTTPPSGIDSSSIKAQEQHSIDETEEKRQRMMDDIKQKMQDAQRKF